MARREGALGEVNDEGLMRQRDELLQHDLGTDAVLQFK